MFWYKCGQTPTRSCCERKQKWPSQLKAPHAPRPSASILALVLALTTWVVLRPDGAGAAPALPGELCKEVAPPTARSHTERWVWDQICVGERADLNDHFRQKLDPHSPDGWTDDRKLGSAFLETILLYDPWPSRIPHHGVRISGAWFDEPVDLSEAEITRELDVVSRRLFSLLAGVAAWIPA